MKPVTEDSVQDVRGIVGAACPLCDNGTRVGYMRFRDPHGMDRVDPELFECETKRHSFISGPRGFRLLASDGQMAPANSGEYILEAGKLKLA